MCNFSGKLIAWIDRELPENEAADVQVHVEGCSECREQIQVFNRVSKHFDACCDAMMQPNVRSKTSRRVHLWSGVAAIAAAVVALLVYFPRTGVPGPAGNPVLMPAIKVASISKPAPPIAKNIHRAHVAAPVRDRTARWLPAEPTFEIAIPAEAIYPPGAFPQGVSFIVDVRVGAYGEAQQIRLRP